MSGDWVPWSAKVPQVEVETHKVGSLGPDHHRKLFEIKLLFTGTEKSLLQPVTTFLGPLTNSLPAPSPTRAGGLA